MTDLVQAGLHVLLLVGKVPHGGHGWLDATRDLGELERRRLAQPHATNVGVQPGMSGYVGVDLDEAKPREATPALIRLLEVAEQHGGLPATLTCRTGSGGRHLWFREHPDHELGQRNGVPNPATGNVESGVDYRGRKGYLVAPPSIHPKTGQPYRWETPSGQFEPDLVLPMPDWLVEFLDPPKAQLSRPKVGEIHADERDQRRVVGMVEHACSRIAALGPGMSRRTTIQREAYRLAGFLWTGYPRSALVERLQDAAHRCGHLDADTVRTIDCAIDDGVQRPLELPPDAPDYATRPWDRSTEALAAAFERAMSRGQLPPDPPPLDDADSEPDQEDQEPDPAELARLPHTDLGNAERFRLRYGSDVRWCEARGQWLIWTGLHWSWDERRSAQSWAQDAVRRIADEVQYVAAELAANEGEERTKIEARLKAVRTHALASQASRRIGAITTEARALRGLAVAADDLDAHPWLLPVRNGTLDLESGVLRASRREDLCTRAVRVAYEPGAEAPAWEAFVAQVLPDEDVRGLVQRALGYALTGDSSEQRWFLLTGEGSNGKSTLLDTIRYLLAEYATVLPAKLLEVRQYEQHPTELMSLLGARFAVGSEPRKGAKWDAERIKSFTGDATIRARAMRKDDLEFACTAKLFVGANELPRTDDLGFGFWRRLVLIPFVVRFEGAAVDRTLPGRLREEAPGILNWMLAGLREWRLDGLCVPAACLAETQRYRGEQDHVARFIEERCEVAQGFSSYTDDLYDAFRRWYETEGVDDRPPSKVAFGKALTRLHFPSSDSSKRRARRHGVRIVGQNSPVGGGNRDQD